MAYYRQHGSDDGAARQRRLPRGQANGYNTQDVDEFIEQVKVEYGRHDAMVREARQRVDAAEARVADAERRAAEAAERAAPASDADDTLKRTLVLAQRTAERTP